MAAQGRPLLGIDINPTEIRVVELRVSGGVARILKAGAVPAPRGAMDGDRIAFPDAVADTLRGLLNRMSVTTRQAVIGIGAQSVITRILDIPRVPDSEVRMVIEGELAHYQIMREGTGAFDFQRLHDPDRGGDANPQVLLMAAEERVIAAFRETAERAGLQIVALEPVLLSLYRAAYAQIQAQPATVCLMVSYSRAEIAIVDHGNIRLYRRVDIGSNDLVPGRQRARTPIQDEGGVVSDRVLLGDDDAAAPISPDMPASGSIVNAAATNLATEIQRSLDYYRREYPQATTVSRIILSTHDPDLESLGEWISQALRVSVVVAEPPIALGTGRAIASQLEAPGGLRFLAGAGLAMRSQTFPATVPAFDLSVQAAEDLAVSGARRKFTYSLAASLALMLIGTVAVITMSRNANDLEHKVGTKRTELGAKESFNKVRFSQIELDQQQLQALRLEGFPFPRLMDAIAATIDTQAGLTELSLDRTGKLTLTGEASNEKAVIKTRDSLDTCPYFINNSLESFEWTTTGNSKLLKFTITSQLAGMRPPPAPGQTGS